MYLLIVAAAAHANPVLPGDFPDPSVIRVGNEYWATATTSQWAPIFPLLHSRDLVSWKTVGAVFRERPAWAISNFWAPEIAQHGGRYFVYYTARKRDGPLCVAVATALKPQGPYTDHGPLVCQEAGSIDAVPVTDENGDRWLVWKEDGNSRRQPTPLWAQRLNAGGTKLVGEAHEILRNDAPWEGHVVEGPFILRRGEWFYMFYSGAGCCGLKCNYALGVARSKKLLGPWEKYDKNPILRENDTWKCPGHGSIVEDDNGRTFLLYHAYHRRDFIWIGRQGLLDEVRWGADGWPAIDGPSSRSTPKAVPPFKDEFTGAVLSPELQWPATDSPDTRAAHGLLHLTARGTDVLDTVIAKAPSATTYSATTRVEPQADAAAGLAAFGSRQNAAGIVATRAVVKLWRREKGQTVELAAAKIPARPVYLRMQADAGRHFRFAFSADGKAWQELRGVDGSDLPPWDLGTRVALTCGGGTATFDFLRIQ
jgi:beta-xylosidase